VVRTLPSRWVPDREGDSTCDTIRDMEPLDDIVREAMTALEGTATPRGYFDELPGRIDARLEGSMQFEEDTQTDDHVPPPGGPEPKGRVENTGLHDIKALAQTTKRRISKRISTQSDAEEALLSSSSSGLYAVALPDPAKISQTSMEQARELARSSPNLAAASGTALAVEPAPARPTAAAPRRGLPVWLWAGGGAIAAAAVGAIAYVSLAGGSKPAEPARAAADRQVASSAPALPAAAEVRPTIEALADPPPSAAVAAAAAEADPIELELAADDAEAAAERRHAAGPRHAAEDDKARKTSTGEGTAAIRRDDGPKQVRSGGKESADKAGAGAGAATDAKVGDSPPKDKPKLDGAVIGAGDKDELGIGDVMRGGGTKKDAGPKKTELSGKEIRAGLTAVTGAAKGCYDKYGISGTVKVKVTIEPSGKVSKVSATGEFAGTPTGDCVAAAVRSATFPSWDGAPMSTTHVVLLSD
jgi:hypothetical protein